MQSIKNYLTLDSLAKISIIIFIFIAVFAFKLIPDIPPDEKDLSVIEGEILVVEPNYAHIKINEKIVKVKYKCLCGHGWKDNKLANSKYLKASVTEKNGDYTAWILLLDQRVIFNEIEGSTITYSVLAGIFGLAVICLIIIFLNKLKQRSEDKHWKLICEQLYKISDQNLSLDERLKTINTLGATNNLELIIPFADIGMLNTLPESIQQALGDNLGRLLAHDQATIDDVEDMFNLLQPATKAAALPHISS